MEKLSMLKIKELFRLAIEMHLSARQIAKSLNVSHTCKKGVKMGFMEIVVNFADKLYVQAQLAYKSGDLFKAKRKYEILLEFPDYSEEAKKLLTIIRNKPL